MFGKNKKTETKNVKKQDKKVEAKTKQTVTKKAETKTKKTLASKKTTEVKQPKAAPKKVAEEKQGIYRVIFDSEDKQWKIKRDGAKRVIDSFATKDEALNRVKELSDNNNVAYVVYKRDGKFQKK